MLRNDLNEAMKQAMKAKDQRSLATIRLILAALKDRDIQARGSGNSEGIVDAEITEMLQKMVRQRRDAIELYTQGGRQDLVDKEDAEIQVIQRFLPKQMSDEEAARAIAETIDELEAASIKDMGRVMASLKERYAGRMDFGKASGLVKQRLV
jgi:uncharacterized protein YqeY